MIQNNKNKQLNLHLIEGLVAIVLLAGLAWFLLSGRPASAPSNYENNSQTTQTQNPDTTTKPSGPATNTPSGTDVIVVSTQTIGSSTVTVDNINLSKPSFVAITIPGIGDQSQVIIGTSKLLTAGSKQDLEINLGTYKLSSKINYVAKIYHDDGDKKFDSKKDEFISSKSTYANFTAK